ncbi:MAG: radical SAM protein [Desulfobacterales bacterium]|nr:radical SAM protein [Desulfobacterales bacterium]
MNTYTPKYIATKQKGALSEKIVQSRKLLHHCTLCPRKCKIDRLAGEFGICSTGEQAMVSSYAPHFGEEPPLVGNNGSGTIFFTNCSLKCCFCQNYEISFKGDGQKASIGQIASIMLHLKKIGCHNINLVTPTHVVPQFLQALDVAIENGLDIPVIYNSSGYESLETLKILDGIIDIYMPDFKFWNSKIANKACHAPDYPEITKQAIKEMHRQVGNLKMDDLNIAVSGLLVRHLVLPENMAGTYYVMKFLNEEISNNTYVNVMSQYHPVKKANKIKELMRPITPEEFRTALETTRSFGLNIIA